MPTILHTLDQNKENHEILHNIILETFLKGECYAFALALSRGLGWPMVGLMKCNVIFHAGVRNPNGHIHDVRGLLTEEGFGAEFMAPPFVIRDITEEELYATRPIMDFYIDKARQFAEILWPRLPWVSRYSTKVKAFADELEALSRKHGLWISGFTPNNPPVLFPDYGDVGGYTISPSTNGTVYTISRHLRQ